MSTRKRTRAQGTAGRKRAKTEAPNPIVVMRCRANELQTKIDLLESTLPEDPIKRREWVVDLEDAKADLARLDVTLRSNPVQLEVNMKDGHRPEKELIEENRLHPESINVRVKNSERDDYRLRHSIKHSYPIGAKSSNVDQCRNCGGTMSIYLQKAVSICSRCGNCQPFEAYILENKVRENSGPLANANASSAAHMGKLLDQFRPDHPRPGPDVCASYARMYGTFHTLDPDRVISSRTKAFGRNIPETPKALAKASERLSMALAGRSVPVFTRAQIDRIKEVRMGMRAPDPSVKSMGGQNSSLARWISRSGVVNAEQGRLFRQGVTTKTHLHRFGDIDDEFKFHAKNKKDDPSIWKLAPDT